MADASTLPTTRSSNGTDSAVALETDTGTGGGPDVVCATFSCLQPATNRTAASGNNDNSRRIDKIRFLWLKTNFPELREAKGQHCDH